MISIEFGKAEHQTLENNSMFIKVFGNTFQEDLNKIKGLWNRTYIPSTHEWEIPYSAIKDIKELFNKNEIRYLNEPPKAKVITKDEILNGLDFNGFNLYNYQVDAIKYGLEHKNFLLLDEQGLGKTLMSISLARYKKQHQGLKHCLVICCVNSLKWNWIDEINKFCKEEKGIILGTKRNSKNKLISMTIEETKKQIDECPEEFFWIINIEKLRYDKKSKDNIVDHLNNQIKNGLGMIIIDEIHKCRNSQTAQRTRNFTFR